LISQAEGLDFANYNNLKYFELNPRDSSLDEIQTPFDFMASLCVRKMNFFSSHLVPLFQQENIFHGYHSGWSYDVHRYFHSSFRSFVFQIMILCTRGKTELLSASHPSALPLEVSHDRFADSLSSLLLSP
jgi:hypothetical protein